MDESFVGIERIAFQDAGTGCLELLLLLALLLLELLELKLKQLVLKPQSAAPLGLLHDCRQIEGAGLKRRGGSEPHSR